MIDVKRIAAEASAAERAEEALVRLQSTEMRGWDEFRAYLEVLSKAEVPLPKGFLTEMFGAAKDKLEKMLKARLEQHEENIRAASNGLRAGKGG